MTVFCFTFSLVLAVALPSGWKTQSAPVTIDAVRDFVPQFPASAIDATWKGHTERALGAIDSARSGGSDDLEYPQIRCRLSRAYRQPGDAVQADAALEKFKNAASAEGSLTPGRKRLRQ